MGIEDERLQRGLGVAARRGHAIDDRGSRRPRLCRFCRWHGRTSAASMPSTVSISCDDVVGPGGGQIDLVQHGDDVQVAGHGGAGVGDGLGFDALGGVDQQQGAFAAGRLRETS